MTFCKGVNITLTLPKLLSTNLNTDGVTRSHHAEGNIFKAGVVLILSCIFAIQVNILLPFLGVLIQTFLVVMPIATAPSLQLLFGPIFLAFAFLLYLVFVYFHVSVPFMGELEYGSKHINQRLKQ